LEKLTNCAFAGTATKSAIPRATEEAIRGRQMPTLSDTGRPPQQQMSFAGGHRRNVQHKMPPSANFAPRNSQIDDNLSNPEAECQW
jgi:hypothetical protein